MTVANYYWDWHDDAQIVGDARDESFRWYAREALDPGAPFVPIKVEDGAQINSHINAVIRRGGSAQMELLPGPDWLVRGEYVLNEGTDNEWIFDLGRFFYSSPTIPHGLGEMADVELYDESVTLTQDGPDATFQIPAGDIVTERIREIIGEVWPQAKMSITDSPKKLRKTKTWGPDATWLQIINDLLDSINYFSLYVDVTGVFTCEPYKLPAERAVVWGFMEGYSAIHEEDFDEDFDTFAVPNKVVALPRSDGTGTPLEPVVVKNENPDSPFSLQARGRWIRRVLEDTDAADQETLHGIALRSLHEAGEAGQSITISHAFVPGLKLNDLVYFSSDDVEGYFSVAGMELTCRTPFMCRTSLRRVDRV